MPDSCPVVTGFLEGIAEFMATLQPELYQEERRGYHWLREHTKTAPVTPEVSRVRAYACAEIGRQAFFSRYCRHWQWDPALQRAALVAPFEWSRAGLRDLRERLEKLEERLGIELFQARLDSPSHRSRYENAPAYYLHRLEALVMELEENEKGYGSRLKEIGVQTGTLLIRGTPNDNFEITRSSPLVHTRKLLDWAESLCNLTTKEAIPWPSSTQSSHTPPTL